MRVRIGFQLSVTMLFFAVALGIGLALVYLSFDRAKSISRSAATAFIERVAEHTADRVDTQFRGALGAVEIVRQLPSIQSGAISDNPTLYTFLAVLLRNHRQLYDLYVGYDDGRFLELDLLDRAGQAGRAQLGAPPEAEFRLTVIDKEAAGGPLVRTTMFLSPSLEVIAQSRRQPDYDPRDRPWFRGGFEPQARPVTEPYVFRGADLIGYTVRAPFTAPHRGIVAGDILLGDTDAFLHGLKLGQSGVALLFDDDGRLVAHPRMAEFLQGAPSKDGTLELPRLDKMNWDAVSAWKSGGFSQHFYETPDRRTHVAAFRTIDSTGAAKLRLAVTAPLDEFFAEIEAERGRLVLLTLASVAATLPLIFWIGSMLSRSMRALALETDRIQRFEVDGEAPRVRSAIREIDDLGRSVATMRTVVQTFGQFVPKRLVQQLVESGAAMRLGGTRREVTVLFTDVENFTNLTEKADPEQVMSYTSRYLAALTAVITEHGGTVDKYVGDCVMAIWNAPTDDPDHAVNACAAVLACRKANGELNAVFEAEGWPAYHTRFGLHTGEVVAGNIGSSHRMNYTVLGATANLAARLEGLNKEYGTEILASEAVVTLTGDRFKFRFVDTVRPKGFETLIRVYELTN